METLNLFAKVFYLNSPVIDGGMVIYSKLSYQLGSAIEDANKVIDRNGWPLEALNNKCGGMIVKMVN